MFLPKGRRRAGILLLEEEADAQGRGAPKRN